MRLVRFERPSESQPDIYINPDYVIRVREWGKPEDPQTAIFLEGDEPRIVVVGEIGEVTAKLVGESTK